MRAFASLESMRTASVAHVLFAATFVSLGIIGLTVGDFAPVWQPVPKAVPARDVLVYVCGAISLASGLGQLWRRAAASASCALLVWLWLWFVVFRLPILLRAPAVEYSWEGCGETAVIIAGAWTALALLASDWDRQRLGFAVGAAGLRAARVIFGAALIPLGLAHFVYLKQTASLVPAWLPAHAAWAYFTGGAYIAAGAAMISGVLARLAAALAALQMGVFTLLVWAPMLAVGPTDASAWSEALDSWALTIAAWVVADSFRLSGDRRPP